MVSNAVKARAVAEGAMVSGAVTGAAVGAIHLGMRGLARVAPRGAAVVGRAAGTVLAAPVILTATAAGAVYGGAKAAARGDTAGGIALGALGGAASMGTNIVADAFIGSAKAAEGDKPKKKAAEASVPAESPDSLDKERERLGAKFGGYDKRIDQAIDHAAKSAIDKSNDKKTQDWWRVRELALRAEKENLNKPKTPEAPPKKGLLQEAKEKIFGTAKPKEDDALSKERRQLEQSVKETSARLDEEFKSRGGKGPKYDALKKERDETQDKLAKLTEKQSAKEAEETAAYRQLGAMVGGAIIGGALGRYTERAAHAAAEAAGKGVAKLAKTAVQAVNHAPKGVIAGTVQGDKAAAAVSVAKTAANQRVVSAVEAFGVPGLNIAHGAVMYKMGQDEKNPAAPIMRMEGAGAIAAGVIGGKFGLAAYSMKAALPHDLAGKLAAAENRIARERKVGPSGVAQARGRRLEDVARGKAGVAKAESGAAVGVAKVRATRDVGVAQSRATGRQAAAKIDAQRPAIGAGSRVGVAKAQGGSRVAVAEVRGKQAVTRQIQKGGEVGRYKNTWEDKRGRIYHRKDMSVRHHANRPANDNSTRAKRA
jgi:hypothetical protein